MVDISQFDKWSLGKLFDYAILPKNTQEKNIREGCREAVKYNCAAFYSASYLWTPIVKEEACRHRHSQWYGDRFCFWRRPFVCQSI